MHAHTQQLYDSSNKCLLFICVENFVIRPCFLCFSDCRFFYLFGMISLFESCSCLMHSTVFRYSIFFFTFDSASIKCYFSFNRHVDWAMTLLCFFRLCVNTISFHCFDRNRQHEASGIFARGSPTTRFGHLHRILVFISTKQKRTSM